MARYQHPGRPLLHKEPRPRLEMKEEEILRMLGDLEKHMLELTLENVELKCLQNRMKSEVDGLRRTLSSSGERGRLTNSQAHECFSTSLDQDSLNDLLEFDSEKLRCKEKPHEGNQEQLTNSIRSQWRSLRRYVERLQAQAAHPLAYKRDGDFAISVTDHDKELAKLKEELQELKRKLAEIRRIPKSQELDKLRQELAESRKISKNREQEVEEIKQEMAKSQQVLKDRELELQELKQELAESWKVAESRRLELVAMRKELGESQKMESRELVHMRQEIAVSRELICQQQQLLQDQLATSFSSELPTPLRGSYFLEEQLRLQEDRAMFEEQKQIFQVERRNFTEAAIRLGCEKKRFDEERGLLAKQHFLNSTPTVTKSETPPRKRSPPSWKRSPPQYAQCPDLETILDSFLSFKPCCTPYPRPKTSGASTPMTFSERRPTVHTVGTPSTAELYRVLKLLPGHRLSTAVHGEPGDWQGGHTASAEYRKIPVWETRVPTAAFSPEPDTLPDSSLWARSCCSPYHSSSSHVATTPLPGSENRRSTGEECLPSTAELYRVLGLTARNSQAQEHRSLSAGSMRGNHGVTHWEERSLSDGSESRNLSVTHREGRRVSGSSKRGHSMISYPEARSSSASSEGENLHVIHREKRSPSAGRSERGTHRVTHRKGRSPSAGSEGGNHRVTHREARSPSGGSESGNLRVTHQEVRSPSGSERENLHVIHLEKRSPSASSERGNLRVTYQEAGSSAGSSDGRNPKPTRMEGKSQTGYRERGNSPLIQTDHYSEICSNLLNRFLDTTF